MPLRQLPLKAFLREIHTRHSQRPEFPFCFVLGAGASIESDIPTGAQLADRWLKELHQDHAPDVPLEQWATAENLHIPGFEFTRRAEFYGDVYARYFEGRPRDGHAYLEALLAGKEPSYGYSVLSWLLSNTPHRIVLTTNFDNLVNDALFLYGGKPPILCGHESLAGHVRAQLHRPLVIKIHRDLFLEPKSLPVEIGQLHEAWKEPLTNLLRVHTPVFLGYGGNDGSLMAFLEQLPPGVPETLYWCVRDGSQPNDRARKLLESRSGALVQIPGFDRFMLLLGGKLQVPNLLPDLESRHRSRVERYTTQLAALTRTAQTAAAAGGATAEQKEISQAALATVQQAAQDDTPETWILRAKAEPDLKQAEALYREAMQIHPFSGELAGAFAGFLAEKLQRFDEAEALLKQTLEHEPKSSDRLHDYGDFLWRYRGLGEAAQPWLEQAVLLRSLALGSEHPDTLKSRASLASALRIEGKHGEAELERRAVLAIQERVLGPEHPDTLRSRMNLANALRAQGKHAEAEQEHRARIAIEERVLGPEHPDTLLTCANLAMALRAQGKNEEAKPFAQRAYEAGRRVFGEQHPYIPRFKKLLDQLSAEK